MQYQHHFPSLRPTLHILFAYPQATTLPQLVLQFSANIPQNRLYCKILYSQSNYVQKVQNQYTLSASNSLYYANIFCQNWIFHIAQALLFAKFPQRHHTYQQPHRHLERSYFPFAHSQKVEFPPLISKNNKKPNLHQSLQFFAYLLLQYPMFDKATPPSYHN